MAEMLKITDLIVNYGVGLFTLFKILLFSTPYFLIFVIPMSIMMAVLLTFLRLSSDNEIIALKTAGIHTYRLLSPVLIFCLIGCLFTLFMAIYGLPWGKRSIRGLTFKVLSSNLDVGLKERTFSDRFNDVMLYVNKIDIKNKVLRDIFIEDKRTKDIVSTVVAPQGKVFSEPGKFIFHLRLYQGIINQVGLEDHSAHTIHFDTYDIRLDLKNSITAAVLRRDRKEMTISELRQYLLDAPKKDWKYYKALMELHKKFSIPFACFALGLLAVPLGIQYKAAKRSSGLVLGLVFFLIYYLMLSAGMAFGENGSLPPLIGMWMPNVVMGGIGLYLLVKTASERSFKIEFLLQLMQRLTSKMTGKSAR